MTGQTQLNLCRLVLLLGLLAGLSRLPGGATASDLRDAVVIAVSGAIGPATAGAPPPVRG